MPEVLEGLREAERAGEAGRRNGEESSRSVEALRLSGCGVGPRDCERYCGDPSSCADHIEGERDSA